MLDSRHIFAVPWQRYQIWTSFWSHNNKLFNFKLTEKRRFGGAIFQGAFTLSGDMEERWLACSVKKGINKKSFFCTSYNHTNSICPKCISLTFLSSDMHICLLFLGCPERSLVGENSLPIPKSHYSASSQYDKRYAPFNAILNGSYGWAPKTNHNSTDYLQIDLSTPHVITAVVTQGSGNSNNEWVTKYKLYYKSRKLLEYEGGTEVSWISLSQIISANTLLTKLKAIIALHFHLKSLEIHIP